MKTQRLRTSPFWLFGFGMFIKVKGSEVRIRKSFRSIEFDLSKLVEVHVERRAFRGQTLVINLTYQTVYFGYMKKRQARKVVKFLESQLNKQTA